MNEVADAIRHYDQQAGAVEQALAAGLEITRTDARCLDLLDRNGSRATAGELARLSGLTTGAITGVIDRLETAGIVERTSDPGDRRRVIVEVLPAIQRRGRRLYEPLITAQREELARYSDEQLEFVRDFLKHAAQLLTDHVRHVEASPVKELPAEPVA